MAILKVPVQPVDPVVAVVPRTVLPAEREKQVREMMVEQEMELRLFKIVVAAAAVRAAPEAMLALA